jgi:hypothetical protein
MPGVGLLLILISSHDQDSHSYQDLLTVGQLTSDTALEIILGSEISDTAGDLDRTDEVAEPAGSTRQKAVKGSFQGGHLVIEARVASLESVWSLECDTEHVFSMGSKVWRRRASARPEGSVVQNIYSMHCICRSLLFVQATALGPNANQKGG